MNNYQNEVLALQEVEADTPEAAALTITTSSQACISAVSAVVSVVVNSSLTVGCGKN